jgi:hypothetical protein
MNDNPYKPIKFEKKFGMKESMAVRVSNAARVKIAKYLKIYDLSK